MHRVLALTVALLVAVLAGLPRDAQAATRELRYADFGPSRGPRAEALQWFDAELRRRSGGALGLRIVWGGALLGAGNAIAGVAGGAADMGSVVAVYEPGRLVSLEAVDVFQVADEWVGLRAAHAFLGRDPAAREEFRAKGLRFIAPFTTGPTQLIARRPVRTPDDLRGLTIRATGSFLAAFAEAGATTVAMSQPEVYAALSTGAIDGSTTYDYVLRAYKLYEVAHHLTELDLGQSLGWGMVMNRRVWDSLTPRQQEIIDQLADAFVDRLAQRMRQSRQAIRRELRAGTDGRAITVHAPDPELRRMLLEAAEAEGTGWRRRAEDRGLPADAMLDRLRRELDTYHAALRRHGYPWER